MYFRFDGPNIPLYIHFSNLYIQSNQAASHSKTEARSTYASNLPSIKSYCGIMVGASAEVAALIYIAQL